MNLPIIILKEYIELEDKSEYDFFMKYSIVLNTPVDHFRLKNMSETQTFGMIKDLQYDLSEGMNWYQIIDYLGKLTGQKNIQNMTIDKICQQWKYIISEINRISEIESIALAYYPTNEEKQAGIDKLSALGSYLQFRNIAKEINLTIDQVKNIPYAEGFLELVTQKKLSDYDSSLIKIRQRNNS